MWALRTLIHAAKRLSAARAERSLSVAPGFAPVCGDSLRFLRGEPGISQKPHPLKNETRRVRHTIQSLFRSPFSKAPEVRQMLAQPVKAGYLVRPVPTVIPNEATRLFPTHGFCAPVYPEVGRVRAERTAAPSPRAFLRATNLSSGGSPGLLVRGSGAFRPAET